MIDSVFRFSLIAVIKRFAGQLEEWLSDALTDLPEALRSRKLLSKLAMSMSMVSTSMALMSMVSASMASASMVSMSMVSNQYHRH